MGLGADLRDYRTKRMHKINKRQLKGEPTLEKMNLQIYL
jgi:hypothetical protein